MSEFPSIVRSDGLVRLNVTLAASHAINAVALAVLNPDIIPHPMYRKLLGAAETLQNLEENLTLLFNQKKLLLMKGMEARHRRGLMKNMRKLKKLKAARKGRAK